MSAPEARNWGWPPMITSGDPETAGPFTECEQHGFPWESDGHMEMSVCLAADGMDTSLSPVAYTRERSGQRACETGFKTFE